MLARFEPILAVLVRLKVKKKFKTGDFLWGIKIGGGVGENVFFQRCCRAT